MNKCEFCDGVYDEFACNETGRLKRGFMFLEDSAWDKARECFEHVLNGNPECAKAYEGLLLCDFHLKTYKELKNCGRSFIENDNYKKMLRFNVKKEEVVEICCANEYYMANQLLLNAENENDFLDSKKIFESICEYKNSAELADACMIKMDEFLKEKKYQEATNEFNKSTVKGYQKAISIFDSIRDYKDSANIIDEIEKKLVILIKETKNNKRKAIVVVTCFVAIFSCLVALWCSNTTSKNKILAKEIEENFVGKKYEMFLTSHTDDYYSSGKFDFGSKTDTRYTYEFYENGKVSEIDNYSVQYNSSWKSYDKTKKDERFSYEYQKDYSVKVSLFGKIMLNIGSTEYEVEINNNNEPISFSRGEDIYK